MHLEVLVTGAGEAAAAQRAGATRLELVKDPERDGLTPDARTIAEVTKAASIPVHVIVRPHDEGFVYGAAERKRILADAARARDLGAAAIVFGALDGQGRIDTDLVQDVVSACRLPMTFHRAFDVARDLIAGHATLAAIDGVERVLTSGGASTAWEGRFQLRQLTRAGSRPHILGGGRIAADSLLALVTFTGLREIHVGSGARSGGSIDPAKIAALAALLRLTSAG